MLKQPLNTSVQTHGLNVATGRYAKRLYTTIFKSDTLLKSFKGACVFFQNLTSLARSLKLLGNVFMQFLL